MERSKAVDWVAFGRVANGDCIPEVVANGEVLNSHTICRDTDAGAERVDSVDENGVSVAPSDNNIRCGDDDLFGVDARVDEDEITGKCSVHSCLDREFVDRYSDCANGRSWQRGDNRFDDLTIGCGAIEDWRTNVVAFAGCAARDDECKTRKER